uniref:Cytochrome c oxidase subunit 3 n=1 Tax=Hypoaspis linteyini TaxID=2695865 RepID=A0A6B9WEN3_9ACAR|nr:cytochrome c oxidase subunit III [Hypoaspis linteyini]QHQ98578.1 cytochrome oxidase subunit 3 [Hypoaspis linteyini]
MMSFHPFHMVLPSPWPILGSFSALMFMASFIFWFNFKNPFILMSFLSVILIMYLWWRDIIRESLFEGSHSSVVKKGLKLGMILFILSEVLFFLSFFWAFFHSSLAPDIEIGTSWPPIGITPFNPYHIPLLNTIILLSSGFSVTWAHHSIIKGDLNKAFTSLLLTVILGIYFSILQAFEYNQSSFCISDSIFGTTFFLTTGFHGIHVLIGTIFLMINLYRLNSFQFNKYQHFSFEAAAWYWHFVDVVWLFLYTFIYWWIF